MMLLYNIHHFALICNSIYRILGNTKTAASSFLPFSSSNHYKYLSVCVRGQVAAQVSPEPRDVSPAQVSPYGFLPARGAAQVYAEQAEAGLCSALAQGGAAAGQVCVQVCDGELAAEEPEP